MIVKKTTGADAKVLCQYLLGPGRSRQPGRATILGGTLLGDDVRTLSAELEALASIRPNIRRPYIHLSFSAHPNDRTISDDEAVQMAEDWAWNADVSAWCLIRHDDHLPKRQHWHFLASRVDEMGVLSRDRLRDYRIQMRFSRKWERFLDLVEVPTPPSPDRPHGRAGVDRKIARADGEARMRGKPLLRDVIRSRLDAVEARGLRGAALREALQAAGLDLDLRMAGGKPKGITWVDTTGTDPQRIKGSDIGKRYTAREWLKRNVLHDPEEIHNGPPNKIVFPQLVFDDPKLDDFGRGRTKPKTSTKPARSGNSGGLDGNMGGPGHRPAVTCDSSGSGRPGNAAQPDPMVEGPGIQDPAHQFGTGSAPGCGAPSVNGTRPDRVGGAARVLPGTVPGRDDDGGPLEPGRPDGMDPLSRRLGATRRVIRQAVGPCRVADSKAAGPEGSSTDGPGRTDNSQLHGPAGSPNPEVAIPQRRGR